LPYWETIHSGADNFMCPVCINANYGGLTGHFKPDTQSTQWPICCRPTFRQLIGHGLFRLSQITSVVYSRRAVKEPRLRQLLQLAIMRTISQPDRPVRTITVIHKQEPRLMLASAPHDKEVFRLYKANSPFDGQQCFADYLNQCLREGTPLQEPWSSAASELAGLIARSTLTQATVLYRATIDAYISPYVKGSEVAYPAFMSTTKEEASVQRHFATSFRDIPAALLKIECPPNLPALNMESDPRFGGLEHEILLPRGSRFGVVSIKEVTDRSSMASIISPTYVDAYSSLKVYELRYKR
jgi:ADP-ribosyltransferase exoenzyme